MCLKMLRKRLLSFSLACSLFFTPFSAASANEQDQDMLSECTMLLDELLSENEKLRALNNEYANTTRELLNENSEVLSLLNESRALNRQMLDERKQDVQLMNELALSWTRYEQRSTIVRRTNDLIFGLAVGVLLYTFAQSY